MRGVQAGEHGPAGAPLERDALHVHGDVDDAVGGGHHRQREAQPPQAGRERDRDERRRVDRVAEPQGEARAAAGRERSAAGQPGDRAGVEGQEGERQRAGRQVEPVLERGDARREAGEHGAGDEERDHGRAACVALGGGRHASTVPAALDNRKYG
jgi:hypothetical protein